MNFDEAARAIVEENYMAVVIVETAGGRCQTFVQNDVLADLEQALFYEEHLRIMKEHILDKENQDAYQKDFDLANLITALNRGDKRSGSLLRIQNADDTISYVRVSASYSKTSPQKILLTYCDETERFSRYILDLKSIHPEHAGINFLMRHMCENIIIANVQTGKSHLYSPYADRVCIKDNFAEQVKWFAEQTVIHEECEAFQEFFAMPALVKCLKKNGGVCTSNWTLSYPDGFHNYFIAACLIHDPTAVGMEHVLAVAKDTTFLNKAQEQIRCDPVTGLYNQTYAKQEISRFLQTPQADNASLFVMDIDHFKEINDCYGHLAGDKAIAWLGVAISEIFSCSDIRCRWGGDEFLILVSHFDRVKTIERLENLRYFMRQYKYNDARVPITLSIGAAQACQGMDFAVLFKNADTAMYTAKKQGRDCMKWSS